MASLLQHAYGEAFSLIRRSYWWWMRHTSISARPGGVPLIFYNTAGDHTLQQVVAMLTDAFAFLDANDSASGGTVRGELAFVAAINRDHDWVLPDARGLASRFGAGVTSSPALLASQLIYAAELIRALRRQTRDVGEEDRPAARLYAMERVKEFLKGLPDGEKWIACWGPIPESG